MGLFDSENAYTAKLTSGFKAGIVRNITIKDLLIASSSNEHLSVMLQNEREETLNFRLFGPSNAYYKSDSDREYRAILSMLPVLEIMNILSDEKVNIKADTWEGFIGQCALKYHNELSKEKIPLNIVLVYNSKGFLTMRQNSDGLPNIERYVEGEESKLVLREEDRIRKPSNQLYET